MMRPRILPSLVALALSLAGASAAPWLTDLPAAQAQAQREGKAVLINFTGSDWCGWCIKLKDEVFSRPEFEAYANKNLALVEVDFPRRKAQSPALKSANRTLAQRYRVRGYPTLVILNAQGNEIGRTGYQPGGPGPFVQELARITGLGVPQPSRAPSPTPPRDLPLYGGAALQPPPRYDAIVLKGISGAKNRRFALLNDQTFAPGDIARVKLGDNTVQVRCLEIREASVVVHVHGEKEPREIKLQTAP